VIWSNHISEPTNERGASARKVDEEEGRKRREEKPGQGQTKNKNQRPHKNQNKKKRKKKKTHPTNPQKRKQNEAPPVGGRKARGKLPPHPKDDKDTKPPPKATEKLRDNKTKNMQTPRGWNRAGAKAIKKKKKKNTHSCFGGSRGPEFKGSTPWTCGGKKKMVKKNHHGKGGM